MTIQEFKKSTENVGNTCKEYTAKIVGVALYHNIGYMVVNACSADVINSADELWLVYENDEMPVKQDGMPMSIFSYDNPEEYDVWLKDIIEKYNIVDEKGIFDFDVLKDNYRIVADYDKDGNIVAQTLLELK